ncbi:DUF3265 domain-containing protein [Photobacterium sp. MCCC 1A19761]|uniref:hypothetical protein n=1 Tax=Photobacterium sp. MCCC 1A19761 TaxID=3115000 RepID=UPI00307D3582
MEQLTEKLNRKGFDAKLKNNNVIVKIDGLSNSVSISKDIALDRYKINTKDELIGIIGVIMLFFGIFDYKVGNGLLSSLLVSSSALMLLTVTLTELKIGRLRKLIDEINLGELV